MIAKNLAFLPRDTRSFSPHERAKREHNRLSGKSLKHILLDRFLNHYGYDKGALTASAIIDDLLALIEQVLPLQRQLVPQTRPDGLACCPRR